jgi:hypothetical protein
LQIKTLSFNLSFCEKRTLSATTDRGDLFARSHAYVEGRLPPPPIARLIGFRPLTVYFLVPLVFGLGAPLVALVGTNVGAGQHERATRVAWIGGFMAAAMCAFIGAFAAIFPRTWLALFDSDPAMLGTGTQYLQTVGPFYGFFGLGLGLYTSRSRVSVGSAGLCSPTSRA